MKKTKIVATIGPASSSKETLVKMIKGGMNVARINLSHGSREEHAAKIENIKKVREELNMPVALMLDTRGPDVRVKKFVNESVNIKKGQHFTFHCGSKLGNNEGVAITQPSIFKSLKVGGSVYANDGMIKFEIIDVEAKQATCVALNSGTLKDNKSLCFPNTKLNISYLNKADEEDIIWGIEQNFEYIAASFVSCADDVKQIKNLLKKHGADIKIICKIENQLGIDNLDEILDVSDGVMVARGDLGVEIPLYEIPNLQKVMIKKCNEKGKISITATEMLESMITNIRPTRAEASDVANAVYDGTSAIMLSGESAMGNHPVEAISTMAEIARVTEKNIDYSEKFCRNLCENASISEIVAHASVNISYANGVKAVVVFTKTGSTAQLVNKFKPNVPVIVATPSEKAYNELALVFGAFPVKCEEYNSTEEMFETGISLARACVKLKTGDKIVIVSGEPNRIKGTNLIKVLTI